MPQWVVLHLYLVVRSLYLVRRSAWSCIASDRSGVIKNEREAQRRPENRSKWQSRDLDTPGSRAAETDVKNIDRLAHARFASRREIAIFCLPRAHQRERGYRICVAGFLRIRRRSRTGHDAPYFGSCASPQELSMNRGRPEMARNTFINENQRKVSRTARSGNERNGRSDRPCGSGRVDWSREAFRQRHA